ncbi:type IV pilin protein [Acidihalobacter prosperus]|uniref:Type IV pilus biogenesis protein PilE n=1 Tax=Acidihalobacter prosperus TaxID=160660 RepID=A0A1A6C4Q5_9GAMM|nr:type IV pilin protein [Acidihalobacter prosperus]OBS09542.1 Type IV pilus biogenesis protein PilE [Acidihalobacter prosperus]
MQRGRTAADGVGQGGFTLIELMVAVAIVAIIAAIAYPSYLKEVRDSRRTTAITNLLNVASQLEKYYSTNNIYPQSLTSLGYTATIYPVPNAASPYYDIRYGTDTTGDTYTLTATPTQQSGQSQDACGVFTLNALGQKGVTSATATASQCWGK